MSSPATHKCALCRLSVPADKLDLPDRCMDSACPLRQLTQEKAA